MIRSLLSLLLLLSSISYAQNITINELDVDTDGVDDKEFIELRTANPNTSLNGHVMVLFNGSSSGGNQSYIAYTLDGITTDINGIAVLGGPELTPSAGEILPINFFQNGTDAVGIYQGDETDFPDQTLATTSNLVDAIVYETDDAENTTLQNLLGLSEQIDEDVNGQKDTQSMQRANDGSWYVADPTPKQLNDGSGVIFKVVDISVSETVVAEGEDLDITLTSSQPVDQDVSIDFSISSGDFNDQDFTGNLQVNLTTGTSAATTTLTILEDGVEEGAEFMDIILGDLPQNFIPDNDNLEVVVTDSDFQVDPWGTPTQPTFDQVSSTAPDDYYSSADGLAGQNLRQEIQSIIADQSVVRAHSYADAFNIIEEADENPENSNEVWMVYTEESRAKYLRQSGSTGTGFWNREHTFPRSRGDFFSIDDDDIEFGMNSWWTTNADSTRHANSDAHALRVVDANENGSRGNKHYGDYTGPAGNQGSFKGDVARAVLYLAVRYEDLQIVNGFPDTNNQLGDLATLLNWHENDPPDDYEMNRNNVVFNWQKNRNPFIDHPELVSFIFGDEFGNVWNEDLSIESRSETNIVISPNPSSGDLRIRTGHQGELAIEIFDLSGKSVKRKKVQPNETFRLEQSDGVYFLKVMIDDKHIIKKLILN